jgi:pyruvate/2-oxoglutarate dehydrogenase complex dihydrolipoamide acyltransferase (E2) component
MRHVRIRRMKDPSSFRKIAAAAWPHPSDSTIFGQLDIRAEKLEAWLESTSERTGIRVTPTHAVARAVALALKEHYTLNGMIRRGTIWLRDSVDVFLQVAIPAEDGEDGKADLSGALIRSADGMSVTELATDLRAKAARIRANEDKDFKRTKGTLGLVPGFLLRPLLMVLDWIQYTLNFSLEWMGLKKDPFGSVMVTSLGMLGVKMAFAPIFPISHCPLLLLVGALEDKPVVEEGELAVGRVLNLTASMDHRMIDGWQASKLAVTVQGLLEEPSRMDLEPAPAEPEAGPE